MITEIVPAVSGVDLPWYSTNWGQFGIMLLLWGFAFGILVGWGLHKNRDMIRKIIGGDR